MTGFQLRTYQVRATNGTILAVYTCPERLDWDDEMGLFDKNDSSWCMGNVFNQGEHTTLEVLQPELWDMFEREYRSESECPCGRFVFELVPKA